MDRTGGSSCCGTDASDAAGTVREQVRAHYAKAAVAVGASRNPDMADGSCCPTTPSGFGAGRYDAAAAALLPIQAVEASLGCGTPTEVADLRVGTRVLDLGSGGGIDVLLAARAVGPTGFVYGVDMTEEMLHLARANADAAGAGNVEFLQGTVEEVPLPDGCVDVVISNCVINLSPDKPSAFTEMFRVLAPGGRVAISDVVADDHLTADDRARRGSHVGCIAGALSISEYLAGLTTAGFTEPFVELTHAVADGMHSAIVRAVKPAP